MKQFVFLILFLGICTLQAQETKWQRSSVDFRNGKLKVYSNHRFLEFKNGTPFFYLADTGRELFHRRDKKDAEKYIETRREKGFTVIHAVALAELEGLNTPNLEGEKPLIGNNPANLKEVASKGIQEFNTESNGCGNDCVLVFDNEDAGFGAPGK